MGAMDFKKELFGILPEIVLFCFAMVSLLLGAFLKGNLRRITGYIALLGYVVAFFVIFPSGSEAFKAFYGMISLDPFSVFFKVLFLVIGFLVVLLSLDFAKKEEVGFGEYYALILIATCGMILMASSSNFVTLFLGLEIMSLSIYALTGITREDPRSVEAAFKYFLLGAFASAFFLYGVALLYVSSGTLDLIAFGQLLKSKAQVLKDPTFLVGLGLLLVGFGFKLALVPFHMWTPDVYEGAPTPITAFMATGVKAAAFAGFLRVLLFALTSLPMKWEEVLWVLSVATMSLGNLIALRQDDIKRMLAYSSIAHAGYILIGIISGPTRGYSAALFYLYAYAFMNIGAFSVVAILSKKGHPNTVLEAYSGIASRHPLLALSMTIFLFSLAGVPPTAGFMAKFYVFSAAVKEGYIWLAVLGVLNSAVAAYYYLRVMVYMYFREPKLEIQTGSASFAGVLTIIFSLWGVLQFGILPSSLLALAQTSLRLL